MTRPVVARTIFAIALLIALVGIFSGAIALPVYLVLIAVGAAASVFMADGSGHSAKQLPRA